MNKIGPYLLGPNNTPENGIYTGDSKELAKLIPNESIDLCFTDPIYQNIDDYRWLAETAARVLKPDSACLVFCGIGYLPKTISMLQVGGLVYRWQFSIHNTGGKSNRFISKGFAKWNSCLWFEKGESEPIETIVDAQISVANQEYARGGHRWRKNPAPFIHWIQRFTYHGAIVFDPFTGGGTVPAVCKMLSRRCLAFEIEPDIADLARDRVRKTQPPLPGLALETQTALEL